jgi:hypothetical protein
MGNGIDKPEIFDPVVLLVFVVVVDLEPGGEWAVMSFPLNDMGESKASVNVLSQVSLASDVVSV